MSHRHIACAAIALLVTLASSAAADNHGAGGMVIGARGSFSSVDDTDYDREAFGLAVHGLVYAIHAEDGWTGKLVTDWHLGGGQADLEGRLRGQLLFGVAPIDHDTPFFRVGMGGSLEGNDTFYFSHFELPVAEAGYHHSDDDFVLELGPRAAAMLTGQYDVGFQRTRQLPTLPSWGAFASLYAGPIWLNATFMRLEDESPIHAAWGHLCGGNFVAICIDGAFFRGRVEPQIATAGYAGLTVGFGMGGPWTREIDEYDEPADDDTD